MDNQKYREYLQSEKWHHIARKRLEIDGFRCVCCGSRGTMNNQLQVHHFTYGSLYHEEARIYEDLVTVCACCHKAIHAVMNRQTSPTGRRGWKENSYIPQVHVFNISGTQTEHIEKGGEGSSV